MYSISSPSSSSVTIRSIGKLVTPMSAAPSKRSVRSSQWRRVRSTGWFSNTMMLSKSAWPGRPAQRWMSGKGACSCSRSARLSAWSARSQSPTLSAGRGVPITGSVLMKRPSMVRAPGSSAGRPETVAPKATVRWPVQRWSSSSHAPWTRVLTVIRCSRAKAASRPVRARSQRV